MTATAPDLIAEIASRYGASVAPGVTVQRLPTGVSSRPYPVWDEGKRQLIVPDWKEQKARMHRASVRMGRKRADAVRAQAEDKLQRLRDMHAQGMAVAAMAEALGISVPYCRSLLSREGLKMQVEPGPKPETLARVALVRDLIAKGERRDAIAQAAGFAKVQYLYHFMRRSMPGEALPPPPGRTKADHAAAGKVRSVTLQQRRAAKQERIRSMVAAGADEAQIGADLGVVNLRHLRRLIRWAVPALPRPKPQRAASALGERDAQIAALLASKTYAEIAIDLGLTRCQVQTAVRRMQKAGAIPPEVARATRARRGKVQVERRCLETEAEISAAYRAGRTVAQIAADRGIGPSRVQKVLRRAGVEMRDWRQVIADQRRAELPALVARGMGGPEIAAHWGCKLSTVWAIAGAERVDLDSAARARRRAEFAARHAAQAELVRTMVLRGDTDTEISRILKIGRSTVQRMVAELGLQGRRGRYRGGKA